MKCRAGKFMVALFAVPSEYVNSGPVAGSWSDYSRFVIWWTPGRRGEEFVEREEEENGMQTEKKKIATVIFVFVLLPHILFASSVIEVAGGSTATLSFSIEADTAYEIDFTLTEPSLDDGVIRNISDDLSVTAFILDSSSGIGRGYLYWKLSTPEQCAISLNADHGLQATVDGVTDTINFRLIITEGAAYVNDNPDTYASWGGGIPDSYRIIGGTDPASVTEADYRTPVTLYSVAEQPEIGSTTHGYVSLAIETENMEGHGDGAHSAALTLTVTGS